MENFVDVFLFGKCYSVPDNLTIMGAMEYAGYQLVRGCGCRNGFCGACATIYRIKDDPLEQHNLAAEYPEIVQRLDSLGHAMRTPSPNYPIDDE